MTMFSRTINEQERNSYLQIAHDLRYPEEIIKRIQRARTINDAERAMTTARQDAIRREEQLYGYAHDPKALICHQSA